MRRHRLDLRRPLDASGMRLEPAGDLSLGVAASMGLPDAFPNRPGKQAAPAIAENLLAGAVSEARELLLTAIAVRPGWAYHRFLLGQADYAEERRSREGSSNQTSPRWAATLRRAGDAAPEMDGIWNFFGDACLEAWRRLSPEDRAGAPAVLRRAFLDASFVSRTFLSASAALTRDRALRLLPEDVDSLNAASQALARAGDLEGVALLLDRIENAEKKDRAADLQRIEERYHLGDVDGLRLDCRNWVAEHELGDFDNRRGRAQAARVLELFPTYRPGTWNGDARGELVRFFLNGREASASGVAMLRAIEGLSGVPDPVAARVRLLAGDALGAETLERRAAEGAEEASALDWTAYRVARARHELQFLRPREAGAVLQRIVLSGQPGCDALLARRDLARANGDSAAANAADRGLTPLQRETFPPQDWTGRRTLPLCVDPDRSRGLALKIELLGETPSVLKYGWDGGRAGTLFLRGSGSLWVPLAGLSGRHGFSVEVQAGNPPRLSATLVRRVP